MTPTGSSSPADCFARDGFAILPHLFSPAEIEPVSAEVDRILSGAADYMPPDTIVFEPGANPPEVRNAFHMHLHHPLFRDLASHPKIVAFAEQILPGPIRLYSSQIFAKPARVGSVVPPHQDMPYWPFDPPEMATVWLALDHSSEANGCVRFAAGSHKLGPLPHGPSGVAGNSLAVLDHPGLSGLPEVAAIAPRGSAVVHHCLTVHRSEPNRSEQPRRGLIYVYMSSHVRLTDPARLRVPPDFPIVSRSSAGPDR